MTTTSPPTNGSAQHGRRRPIFGPPPTMSTAEAVKRVAEDASALAKAEINLAKEELKQGVQAKAKGAGLFAAAGVLGLVAAVFLLVMLFFLLSEVAGLPGWASSLIIAVVFLAGAGVLAVLGKRAIGSADISVETTKQNVEEDIAWAKQHLTTR